MGERILIILQSNLILYIIIIIITVYYYYYYCYYYCSVLLLSTLILRYNVIYAVLINAVCTSYCLRNDALNCRPPILFTLNYLKSVVFIA